MTTEEDFQAELDRDPTQHVLRTILADLLQDADDPRAEGYRALGVLRKTPDVRRNFSCYWRKMVSRHNALPDDWFLCIAPHANNPDRTSFMRSRPTRREAEDAAALAFAKLPAERRAELLQQGVPT